MPFPNSSSPSGESGTSSIPTLSTTKAAAEFLLVGALTLAGAALGCGVAVALGAPGARILVSGLALGGLAGVGTAMQAGRRQARRLGRLRAVVDSLRGGKEPAFLVAERQDALGVVEGALGEGVREIREHLEDLRIEQGRFQAILRGMVEGVLVTDLDGRVVLANTRAADLFGTPAPVGHLVVELARDPAMSDLMRELTADVAVASRDVQLDAGRGPTVQVNGARLAGPDGASFGLVLVLHDVTELRRLEVVRRDFVANVSHELRTPLTAIKGYAETLLGLAGDDRETARRFLSVIDRHSERLGRLVDDLLVLSDLELGRTPMQVSDMPIGPAVDDVLQIFGDTAQRAGVRVLAHVAADTPRIRGDGDRIRQVLINLIDNAIKYTPRGGEVVVRVRTDVPGHPGMVEIAVSDSGVGIPAEDLPRLTERFFRVDKARSRELGGTGLGLAIVKHIVQHHGGTLDITSALGHGTTVAAYFPVAPAAGRVGAAGGSSGR